MTYYSTWTEDALKNALWDLSDGRSIPGPFCDPDLIRAELRRRGMSDRGYHNT